MDKGILNEVIEAEKDIQGCIEAEQARLREVLEGVRREAAEAVAAAEREIGAAGERDLAALRQEAEAKARDMVAQAAARAGQLERIDDGTLTKAILKRIPRILTE